MSSARGLRFTFTPHQGWSTSSKSPVKIVPAACSSSSAPPPSNTAALLSISPTVGFESFTCAALPSLVSPRAHLNLTRCTSAPPVTPSPRSKRKRHAQQADSEDDDHWSYSVASECREPTGTGVADEQSVDAELSAIANRPLSILVSPVCIRGRPHCPIPVSPAESTVSSASSVSTAPSPRRPLFVNRLVAADSRPSTAPSSTPTSASSASLPPLPSFSLSTPSTPQSSSQTASTPITATPSSSCTTSSTTLSFPPVGGGHRSRYQWRRFRLGATDQLATDGLIATKRTLPRRIIPTLCESLNSAIILPSAPLAERSQSTGSAGQHASPKRRTAIIPSSPPPPPSSKRRKTATMQVECSSRSHSVRRSWSRGEQRSIQDYLMVA